MIDETHEQTIPWRPMRASSAVHGGPDERDQRILIAKEYLWDKRHSFREPRVGDFIQMLDGRLMRFSHDWGDDIQVSEGGSFYFGDGFMSFSGGLEPTISKITIKPTGETRMGWAWFFHHNSGGAHRGVQFETPCRVFEQVED